MFNINQTVKLSQIKDKDFIVKLKTALQQLKFYDGDLDCINDDLLLKAFEKFKGYVHLNSPDLWGPTTQAALERVTSVKFSETNLLPFTYLRNYKNTETIDVVNTNVVKEIQQILKENGYYNGLIDGKNTSIRKSFIKWKTSNNIGLPEYVGPQTIQILLDLAQLKHPTPVDDAKDVYKLGEKLILPDRVVYLQSSINFNGNFTWSEFTKFGTRVPKTQEVVNNIIELATRMEDVRQWLGNRPLQFTSAYRPADVNRAVGGVIDSQHVHGKAVDFTYEGDLNKAYEIINKKWFGGVGDGRARGFIHLDTRPYQARFGY